MFHVGNTQKLKVLTHCSSEGYVIYTWLTPGHEMKAALEMDVVPFPVRIAQGVAEVGGGRKREYHW